MYQSDTIVAILKQLNDSHFLPAIQREFVWKPTQVTRLFDSVMQDYPIGSFLFWQLERLVEIEGPFATDAPQRLPHLLMTQFSAPEFTWLYRAWENFIWRNRSTKASLYPWMRHWKRTQQAQEARLGGAFEARSGATHPQK